MAGRGRPLSVLALLLVHGSLCGASSRASLHRIQRYNHMNPLPSLPLSLSPSPSPFPHRHFFPTVNSLQQLYFSNKHSSACSRCTYPFPIRHNLTIKTTQTGSVRSTHSSSPSLCLPTRKPVSRIRNGINVSRKARCITKIIHEL